MTISGGFSTSYFSAPARELDPTLFDGRALKSWVRNGIVTLLNDFLGIRYRHMELWSHPWLAGSAISYQWQAARQPGDLDCLIGINFVQFRKANPEFRGLTDSEIAEQLNEEFRNELHGQTENWNGFELTFYVNPIATDIRSIKPYAAYDLKYNEWTVHPDPNQQPPQNADWDRVVESDTEKATQIATRFNQALQDLRLSQSGAAQRNAENRMTVAGSQGVALYNEIHLNRSIAFSPGGQGYGDFHNYRWQAGKRSGAINQLRQVKKQLQSTLMESNPYGVELPDTSTLIRRAALYRNK